MRIAPPDQTVARLLAEAESKSRTPITMQEGQPLFTKEDIERGKNNLDRQLRYFCDYCRMGKDYLINKAVDHYQLVEGHGRERAKSNTQNLIRALEKGDITYNRFEELFRVLGYEILDQSTTVRDQNGNVTTFSTSDAIKRIKEKE